MPLYTTLVHLSTRNTLRCYCQSLTFVAECYSVGLSTHAMMRGRAYYGHYPFTVPMQSLFESTVPVFTKALTNLSSQLDKAAAHVAEAEHATFPKSARLAPDMFPLIRQVQIACDNAKGGVARLTGKEMPKFEDTEESFSDAKARIEKTLALLAPLTEQDFAGAAERKAELPYFPGKYMTGADYAREYLIPNFFFHVAMAYAVMRNAGVPLGKGDFLGSLPLQDNA